MTAISQYKKRDVEQKGPKRGRLDIWRRLVAEDSLLSPFRLLLMLAIIVVLVAAVLVAIAF